MAAAWIRLGRCIGWASFFASVVLVLATVFWQAGHGPDLGQAILPSPRLSRLLINTMAMAGTATMLAQLLALPAAAALLLARRPWQRGLMLSLTLLPLMTLPSSFAYAWMLLATSRIAWVARAIEFVGWNRPGWQSLQAAWALATWLWPIPALVLVAAFRHVGRRSYQLASLDARPMRALLIAALPVLRGPLLAALAIVFILAATDSTIPPLMNATQVWSVEMLAQASVASSQVRPVGYVFWQAWPLLAVIAVLACAAWPQVRRMERWVDETDGGDTGTRLPTAGWIWWAAFAVTSAVTVLPVAVFTFELSTGRSTAAQALATAYRTLSSAGLATLVVAACAAVSAVCIALALLDEPEARPIERWIARAGFGLVIAAALLPAELSGTALVGFWTRWTSPAQWNLYDHTPCVWISAMLVRFAFVPVFILQLLNRRVPGELIMVATSDGASSAQRLHYARMPFLGRGLIAAGLMVGCLTMSEAAVSVLVQPPQFFGGSLAVAIDSQMHYGRQNETIASALILMFPAMIAAILAPITLKKH
jgi:ABC-type Fe3+ transport system permease subunit